MAEELDTPEAPSPGKAQVYPGADGRLYLMTGDGVAVPIMVARAVVHITDADSPYDVDDTNGIIFIDAGAGAVDVNLPPGLDSRPEGYAFKATDATNDITIIPSGSETIDGAAQITLNTYDAAHLVWSGDEWAEL